MSEIIVVAVMTPEHPRWDEFFTRLDAYVYAFGCSGDATQLNEDGKVFEETLKQSPLSILKKQVAEQSRKIAHLEEQLAAAETGSLFDLGRDSAESIVAVMTDSTVLSEHKATKIARGILAAFKNRQKPAG